MISAARGSESDRLLSVCEATMNEYAEAQSQRGPVAVGSSPTGPGDHREPHVVLARTRFGWYIPAQFRGAMSDSMKGAGMGHGMLIATGALTVVLGIMAIVSPLATGIAVAVSVGVLLVAMGIARITDAIRGRKERSLVWGIIAGILAVVVGLLTITRPMVSVMSLTLFLAFYLFAHGIVEIIAAFKMRPEAGWGWKLFNSIITVLLGLAIWRQWPVSGAWALGVIVGVHILTSGWTMVAVGLAARRIARAGQANE